LLNFKFILFNCTELFDSTDLQKDELEDSLYKLPFLLFVFGLYENISLIFLINLYIYIFLFNKKEKNFKKIV